MKNSHQLPCLVSCVYPPLFMLQLQRTTHCFLDTSCSFMTLYQKYLYLHSPPSEHFLKDTIQAWPSFPNSSIPWTEFTTVILYHCVYLFSFISITTWFCRVYCELFSTGTTLLLEVPGTKYLYLFFSHGYNCQVTNTIIPAGSHSTDSYRTPSMYQVLGLGIQLPEKSKHFLMEFIVSGRR